MPGDFEHHADHVGHESSAHAAKNGGANGNGGGIPSGSGLGKYRILERIRSAYNATVYKARDTMLDRLVAIKHLTPALMDNPMACGDFRREAQMMARFTGDCRHVIGIHELIEEQQGLFIVHEHVDGRWLESHVAKREIDGDRSLRVFGTLAMGIRSLHALGIVHRDIRPPNVIICPGLGAKIVDLSCAGAEGDYGTAPTGAAKYSAPEFLLGESYDDRIDIYSLGMVMYEVFIGRIQLHDYFSAVVADPRTSNSKWREWHCEYDLTLPAVADINPSIPRVLSNLVERMTAKRVDERISSISEVIDTLTRILRDRRMDASRRLTGRTARDMSTALPSSEFNSAAANNRLLTGSEDSHFSPSSGRPTVQPWQTTTAIPAMPRTLGPARAVASAVAMPGTSAFRGAASTTKHRVRADSARIAEQAVNDAANEASKPRAAVTPTPIHYAKPQRIRRPTVSKARPRIATAAKIPTPEPVEERVKPLNVARLVRIAAALVIVIGCASIGGYFAWHKYGPGAHEPIRRLIAGGKAAFAEKNYSAARSAFDQARLDASLVDVDTLRHDAEHWMLLVDAAEYFVQDRFDDADRRLDEAVRAGADARVVDDLRDQIFDRKVEIRLKAEIDDDLKRGDVASAEKRLRPFEDSKNPPVPVEEYREQFDRARREGKYGDHIETAIAQMDRGDYQSARVSVNAARKLRNGSEVDQLEKRITDRQLRDDWVNSANKALTDGDFDRAIDHYEKANRLETSAVIEAAIKQATAYKLIREARAAFDEGNILGAQQLLKNSIWSFDTPEAGKLLNEMAPAIAAAEQERQADQDADQGKFESAISKYEWALPKLKSPADVRVKGKLARAKRAKMVADADALYQSREFDAALKGYQAAQKAGEEDPDITAKIQKTRQMIRFQSGKP